MSRPSYVQTVAPTLWPFQVEELVRHCRAAGVAEENTLLQALQEAAVGYVQDYQWCQLLTATWEMRLDRFPCDGIIELHPNPVLSITSLAYVDTGGTTQTLTANTDYTVDLKHRPARIVPAYTTSWPATRGHINDVVVTFTAGYGAAPEAIPQTIRHAMLLLIGHWYWNRESTGAPPTAKDIAFATKALLDLNSFRVFV